MTVLLWMAWDPKYRKSLPTPPIHSLVKYGESAKCIRFVDDSTDMFADLLFGLISAGLGWQI